MEEYLYGASKNIFLSSQFSSITVTVASLNPVKLACVKKSFEKVFKGKDVSVRGVSISSGVSDQPMGDEETLQGALNRSQGALEKYRDSQLDAGDLPQAEISTAHYFVGIEGGATDDGTQMECMAWIVVRDTSGRIGRARTGTFQLPKKVRELVLGGMELGPADDQVGSLRVLKLDTDTDGIDLHMTRCRHLFILLISSIGLW